MKLISDINIKPWQSPLQYKDKVFLIGSCFTEHMEQRLQRSGFQVLANPFGVLFSPWNIMLNLQRCINKKQYRKRELFPLNELWNSWDHHTRFSHRDADTALQLMNDSLLQAHDFIKEGSVVVVFTFGTAFQYILQEDQRPVANNHRAPGDWFRKELMDIQLIEQLLHLCMKALRRLNRQVRFIFTVSPVRHLRDGVIENNRSKARLIEVVHSLVEQNAHAHYFPAYELVIDVLRDYRFYDIDLAHPNFAATQFVWEHFVPSCIDSSIHKAIQEAEQLFTAAQHRPRFPDTEAHQKFLHMQREKLLQLKKDYPEICLKDDYFNT